MKDLIVPVNNEAHSRALISVVGEETAQVILRAYTAIDSAMVFGYERGKKDAAEVTQADQGFSAAWDDGHTRGLADGYVKAANESDEQGAYDEGYIDGVSDARVCPSDADARVAELCGDDDYAEDEDNYDYEGDSMDELEYYEGDSGDETDSYYDWHTDMEEQLSKTPVPASKLPR